MDIQVVIDRFYDYLTHIKGYSPNTIKRYKNTFTLYCRYAKVTAISEITVENVKSFFLYGRVERKWSSQTFIIFHKSMRVFFRWCNSEGYLHINPVLAIEKPKVESKIPKRLTKQEALQLLELVYNYPYEKFLCARNHAIFATCIYAGLRKSEVLELKYADVDIENMTMFVRHGKGAKDRMIPICPALAESLKRYLVERKRKSKTCPAFFASYILNNGLSPEGLKHMLRKFVSEFKIKFSMHSLRHTFATLMLEGGCDLYSLSKMMGHSDIKTTTIYLAASVEHLRMQINRHPLSIQ